MSAMGQVSPHLRRTETGFAHFCPGCGEMHTLPDSWVFVNKDLSKPTFQPSFKHSGVRKKLKDGRWTGEWEMDSEGKPISWVCHYNLTNGVLQFHADCTHVLKGIQVPLPVLPACYQDGDA